MLSAAGARFGADAVAIDLDALAKVANLPGDREVVSRRWLRQVLCELTDARRPVGWTGLPAPALDVSPPPANRG